MSFPGSRPNVSKSPAKQASPAFTLLELLVVIGILAILLVAIVPAINSLSKSSGRKGAIGNLQGAIEQARAQAIRTGVATYLVLPGDIGSTDPNLTQRYSYRSYAIFEDDPTTPKQLTPWRTLPTGISIRSKVDSGTDRHGGLSSLPTGISFPFQPTNSSLAFPYIKFSANGEIDDPPTDVWLVLFEGSVAAGGSEIITGAKDSFGNPTASEALNISRLTGRAQPTATPTPSS
jgi:prepilin-type N-terminal cleavage/methylation domain-containing protein